MSLQNKLMSVGQPAAMAQQTAGDVAATAVATGTTQADALPLSCAYNYVTTVDSGTGVRLYGQSARPSSIGDEQTVYNAGANALNVYPPAGEQILGVIANAAFSIPTSSKLTFKKVTNTLWVASETFVQSGSTPAYGFATRTAAAKMGETLVSVKDFKTSAGVAVAGNGVQDDTTGIQSAIDWCILNGRKLFFPVGVYSITAPLFIYKWTGTAFGFCSLEIEGEKLAWNAEVSGAVNSARIVPTFVNTFAIGIQNGRGVRIKDMALIGQNNFYDTLSADFHEMMTNSTFVTGSCRNSRYSPYSGICIDPFGTSTPGDGGYPNLSSFYVASASGSSFIDFEGIVVNNFVVGVMITPNGTTQNAENITFRKCGIDRNRVNIGIGQSQSRNVAWFGGSCAFALYCIDGNSYGAQQGSPPQIRGINMSGKYLFNLYGRAGEPLDVSGLYAETFASIGFLGGAGATSSQPHRINGAFSFYDFGTGVFPDHHLVAQNPVHFDACSFSQAGTYLQPVRFYHREGAPITFTACEWLGTVQGEFYLAPTVGVDSVEFTELYFNGCVHSDGDGRGNSVGQNLLSHNNVVFTITRHDRSIAPNGALIRIYSGTATDIHFVGGTLNSVSLGALTVTTGANGTATFTASDASIINTGDLIYTSTSSAYEKFDGTTFTSASDCLGVVSNINGTTITITGWPQSLVTGTFTLKKRWWSRMHQASTGDIATNTTISNVTNPSTWVNGNAIKGAGIPSGAYIVSGGGTATLTISKAATATTNGIRLFDADIYKITGTAV